MLFKNAKVFIDGCYRFLDVKITNNLISEIGIDLVDDDVLDCSGMILYPGFIDSHIHGACGVFCGYSEQSMRETCSELPQYGVTSFIPTPIVDGSDESRKLIKNIRAAKNSKGSKVRGIFLYTPYKSRSSNSITQPPVLPSKETTMAYADDSLEDILAVSFSPELEGSNDWISWLVSKGIRPVIAFSKGNPETINKAVKLGATMTDHFPNGFAGIDHHEDQGVVQCLLEDNLYMQINCDCVHVSPAFIKMMLRLKGEDKLFAVSDSSPLVGKPDGEYTLFNHTVYLKDGSVRDETGKLVTGAHPFDANMRIMKKNGFSLETIGKLFTENAAKAWGFTDIGKIEVGRCADLVLMDEELNVVKTFIDGDLVYSRNS